MKDIWIEITALFAIILGLLLGYFFIFDYAPKDAFFLDQPDNNAYLTGKVLNISATLNGETRVQIESCRIFNAYYAGQISNKISSIYLDQINGSLSKINESSSEINESSIQINELNNNITIYGSFLDGVLFIKSYN